MTRTEREPRLMGKVVSLTGRLSSMSRENARQLIGIAGARYRGEPDAETDILVVGQDGPPLGEDGRLTGRLRRALELREEGHEIEIIGEHEWLDLLGLEEHQEDLHRLYTPDQVSRILGVSTSRVRTWVRHGLIQPARRVGRLSLFDFSQVSTLRALARLIESGVTAGRLQRSLRELGHWHPAAERSLAQLESLEQAGDLFVRLEDGRLAEPSGQLMLDYDAPDESPEPALPLRGRAVSAGEWFEVGIRSEEIGRLEEAVGAYERSMELGGVQAETCFNLGNVLYQLERKEEAADRFRQAAELEPDYVEAWNNLGNALGDLARVDEAISAYRRALAIAPDYADAHFNLGEALARAGQPDAARRHWQAYLAQDPNSPWADKVRERLDEGSE